MLHVGLKEHYRRLLRIEREYVYVYECTHNACKHMKGMHAVARVNEYVHIYLFAYWFKSKGLIFLISRWSWKKRYVIIHDFSISNDFFFKKKVLWMSGEKHDKRSFKKTKHSHQGYSRCLQASSYSKTCFNHQEKVMVQKSHFAKPVYMLKRLAETIFCCPCEIPLICWKSNSCLMLPKRSEKKKQPLLIICTNLCTNKKSC